MAGTSNLPTHNNSSFCNFSRKIMDTEIIGQKALKNPMFFFIHFISSIIPMFIHPHSSRLSNNRKIHISNNYVLSTGFHVITTRVSYSTTGSPENLQERKSDGEIMMKVCFGIKMKSIDFTTPQPTPFMTMSPPVSIKKNQVRKKI